VRLYLAEKAQGGTTIPLEMELVNLVEGAQRAPKFLAKNPLGKLPVLELDDGTCVAESLAIIEFLEDLHPKPTMIGATPVDRLRVRSADRLADVDVLSPMAGVVHSTRSPLGLPANPQVEANCRERLEAGLAEVDARLGRHEFVAGDRISVADCTLYAGLCFGSFFGVEVDAQHRNVARWRSAYAQRPAATLP
jgi:glutathione S-transferase